MFFTYLVGMKNFRSEVFSTIFRPTLRSVDAKTFFCRSASTFQWDGPHGNVTPLTGIAGNLIYNIPEIKKQNLISICNPRHNMPDN